MQSNYFVSDIQSMINSSHMTAVQTINGPHHLISSTQNGNVIHNNGQSMLPMHTVPSQNHVSANEQHRCAICGDTFRKMANLKRHMKSHTTEIQPKVEPTIVTIGTVSNTNTDSPYKCNACKIEYPNAAIFEHHIRTEHGQPSALKCTQCGCFRPILLSSVTPFRCETCTERNGHGYDETGFLKYRISNAPPTASVQPIFVSPSKTTKMDLSSMITTPRMTEASGRRPRKLHQCMECGKTYKHQSTLAMHKKIHTGEYKYKCEYCDKEFYLTEYYNRHMRVHTKEKPYQCDVCDKAFSQSNTLTQHKRIHTGEKPYECNVCGKNFTVKDYLMKHIRVHTGEKPFECNICGKKYTQRSGLRTHQKTHFQHQTRTDASQSMPAVVVMPQQFTVNSNVRLM